VIRYLLDTDTVTLWLHGDVTVTAAVRARDARVIGVPVVVVEEIWDGWQAVIKQAKSAAKMAFGYGELTAALSELRPFAIVPHTEAAIHRHAALKKLKLNVGGNDLKIAAVALELGMTVVTNNEGDFRRVPGLAVENWATS
jgi:tRNA(fMet)-specific endonuclease VapC